MQDYAFVWKSFFNKRKYKVGFVLSDNGHFQTILPVTYCVFKIEILQLSFGVSYILGLLLSSLPLLIVINHCYILLHAYF